MELILSVKHQKTTAFILGALASLGFAPFFVVPLVFICFVSIWLIADTINSYKKAALLGYVYGVGFFSAGFYWIGNALLIDVARFGFLYPITLLALGAFFGLFMILPFVFWHYFVRKNICFKIGAFAIVFVLMEYLRSFLLTGFPWNMLGTVLAFDARFIQLASVGGTYLLSLIVLILAGSIYACAKGFLKSGLFVFCVVSAFVVAFGFYRISTYQAQPSNIKIRVVQPSIKQSMKWDENELEKNLDTYIKMSQTKGLNNVQFVVWSETASAFDPRKSHYIQNKIKQAVPKNGYLVTGLIRYDDEMQKAYNSVSVINDQGNTVAFYDKYHLVPFGEYLPFSQFLPEWMSPIARVLSDLSSGEKLKNIDLNGVFKFGVLICYEIIFPDEVVNRNDKPMFLFVLSNDAWYGQSSGPYQHLVSAQMRAVEEGITIIRGAGNGVSALIDPMGRVVSSLELNQKGVFDVELAQNSTVETIYSKIKSVYIQGLLLVFLFVLFLL